jgi:uncharacterized protein (TIGR03435 family)
MARLGKKDRDAVLLRYFKDKNLREVAAALKVNETAAQKRVHRAVEKLRAFFTKRGIILPAAVLTAAISANSVQAAPVALAKAVTAVAIAKGATASLSTLTLIKGALKIMAWTKMKTAIVVGVVILLAAGTTSVTVKKIKEHSLSWQVPKASFKVLYAAFPQVRILPTKFTNADLDFVGEATKENIKALGISEPFLEVVCAAYEAKPSRAAILTELPPGKFDFIANLSTGSAVALQQAIKKDFGITARRETLETDVLLLTLKTSDSINLKVSASKNQKEWGMRVTAGGKFGLVHEPISWLALYLEQKFKMPVLDRTGLKENYDLTVEWDEPDWHKPNLTGLKQSVLDQLGLELVPSREPVEVLAVEKVK